VIKFIKRWWTGLEKKEQAHYDSLIEMIKDQGRARFNMPKEELDPDIIPGVEIINPGEQYVGDVYTITNNSDKPVYIGKNK